MTWMLKGQGCAAVCRARTRPWSLPGITSLAAVLLGACTITLPDLEPQPVHNLSDPETGGVLTFDLREGAGIQVVVEGEPLTLLLLARSESLLTLNPDIAETLDLPEVMFGLGSASVRDADHRVDGEVVRARYSVAGGPSETGWALVMEAPIYADYDGAISFGAIPADTFRLWLNDIGEGVDQAWFDLVLEGRSARREQERDYEGLEFSQTLALYQTPVSVNRKATLYLNRAGRLGARGAPAPFSRLFGNTQPHIDVDLEPGLEIAGFRIEQALAEVNADGGVPGDVRPGPDGGVVVVSEDLRGTAYAPTVYLGRSLFAGCSELQVAKDALGAVEARFAVRCRSDWVSETLDMATGPTNTSDASQP